MTLSRFDFAAVGRAMIAEPDWPLQVQAGKVAQLKPFSPALMADPLLGHLNEWRSATAPDQPL